MKKKKVVFTIILFLLVCGIGIGSFIIWMRQKDSAAEEEITVKENQSLIVAQINTINGNEITFAEAEEMDLSSGRTGGMGENNGAFESSGKENGSSTGENQNGEEKNAPSDNSMAEQQMPQGGMGESQGQTGGNMTGDRNMSSGGARPGGDVSGENMPGGEDRSSRGMPGGDMSNGNSSGGSDESEAENGKTKNKTMYRVTGEEQTMLIPVGTTVTTQFGTTTTFSRLATGDMVKILLEKNENNEDVIVGVWMIQ